MYLMIANTHDFQINVLVDAADGTSRNVAIPPKQRGQLEVGETVSEKSKRDYPKLKIAEVPDDPATPPAGNKPTNVKEGTK